MGPDILSAEGLVLEAGGWTAVSVFLPPRLTSFMMFSRAQLSRTLTGRVQG